MIILSKQLKKVHLATLQEYMPKTKTRRAKIQPQISKSSFSIYG